MAIGMMVGVLVGGVLASGLFAATGNLVFTFGLLPGVGMLVGLAIGALLGRTSRNDAGNGA